MGDDEDGTLPKEVIIVLTIILFGALGVLKLLTTQC